MLPALDAPALRQRGNARFQAQDYDGAVEAFTLLLGMSDELAPGRNRAEDSRAAEEGCSVNHRGRVFQRINTVCTCGCGGIRALFCLASTLSHPSSSMHRIYMCLSNRACGGAEQPRGLPPGVGAVRGGGTGLYCRIEAAPFGHGRCCGNGGSRHGAAEGAPR